jgi:hypothetical protein
MIPNLKRIGLLTEKIRPKFEELGVLEFENLQHDGMIDWAVLEAPLVKRDGLRRKLRCGPLPASSTMG